jgi:hypothetical protein
VIPSLKYCFYSISLLQTFVKTFPTIFKKCRITFRLFTTFGAEKNHTKAVGRLRFFVARGRYCARSIYSPRQQSCRVMRSKNQLRNARHGRRADSFFVHIYFYFHAIFIFFECIAQSDKYKFIKF